MTGEWTYLGHVKGRSNLEETVMTDVVPGRKMDVSTSTQVGMSIGSNGAAKGERGEWSDRSWATSLFPLVWSGHHFFPPPLRMGNILDIVMASGQTNSRSAPGSKHSSYATARDTLWAHGSCDGSIGKRSRFCWVSRG